MQTINYAPLGGLGSNPLVTLVDEDEMGWLREVHLPGLPATYKSAWMEGDPNDPKAIFVYAGKAVDTTVGDLAEKYERTEFGYRFAGSGQPEFCRLVQRGLADLVN